jgi:hypothetical protein
LPGAASIARIIADGFNPPAAICVELAADALVGQGLLFVGGTAMLRESPRGEEGKPGARFVLPLPRGNVDLPYGLVLPPPVTAAPCVEPPAVGGTAPVFTDPLPPVFPAAALPVAGVPVAAPAWPNGLAVLAAGGEFGYRPPPAPTWPNNIQPMTNA